MSGVLVSVGLVVGRERDTVTVGTPAEQTDFAIAGPWLARSRQMSCEVRVLEFSLMGVPTEKKLVSLRSVVPPPVADLVRPGLSR